MNAFDAIQRTMEKPCRIQLRRVKGWRMPPNTVKVARPSRWGNPYRVGPLCDVQTAVNCFRKELEWHIKEAHLVEGVTFWQKLDELRGKNLACFCALDQPCHADVLLELANFAGAGGLRLR